MGIHNKSMRGVLLLLALTTAALVTPLVALHLPLQEISEESFFGAIQPVSLVQLTRAKTGIVVIPGLNIPFNFTLAEDKWWNSTVSKEYITSHCTSNADNSYTCSPRQIQNAFEDGITTCKSCETGQYLVTACTIDTDTVCAICSTWQPGTYRKQGSVCSDTSNAEFLPCTPLCETGTYQTVACTEETNRVCKACTARSSSQYISQPCVSDRDDHNGQGKDAEFSPCLSCDSGTTYASLGCGGSDGSHDRVCQKCTDCSLETSSYEASPCTVNADAVCAVCSACTLGLQFRQTPCSKTRDTVCTPCSTKCADNQFLVAGCTDDKDIQCQACSSRDPPHNSYRVAECSATADVQFKTCSECPTGTFQTAACTDTTDTQCQTCSTCASGTYLSSTCGSKTDTVCKACLACAGDEFIKQACAGSEDTQCTSCDSCRLGFEVDSSCTRTNNTVCKACDVVPHTEFVTSGSCENECESGYQRRSDQVTCFVCSKCNNTQHEFAACSEGNDAVCYVSGYLEFLSQKLLTTDNLTPGLINLTSVGFTFSKPVVIMSPPTDYGTMPTVLRISKPSDDIQAYKAFLVESGDPTTTHPREDSSVLVLEEGSGPNYVVGTTTVETDPEKPRTVVDISLTPLGNLPFVFPFIQSSKNGAFPTALSASDASEQSPVKGFVKPRVSLATNSPTSFELILESFEGYNSELEEEVVGYLAIDSGCSQTQSSGDVSVIQNFCFTNYGKIEMNGKVYDYAIGASESLAAGAVNVVAFGKSFSSPPHVFAQIQSYRGKFAELRIHGKDVDGFQFVLEADTTGSTHTSEAVAWLAIGTRVSSAQA